MSPGWQQAICALFAALVLLAGCAIPGRLYLVAPAVSGTLRTSESSLEDVRLMLSIQHRESPILYHNDETPLTPEGAFTFEAVQLAIAGHEYSKYYRAYLHVRSGADDRVIWRAEFSRRMLGGTIRLDCDLERPAQHGQPCQVSDPLNHPWLIAEGERTYGRLCAECHGPDGSGASDAATALGVTPPDLRAIAVRRAGRFDRAEISEWIEGRFLPEAHGTRRMPVWGERLSKEYEWYVEGDTLIGATLDPLVAYLQSLQQP